MLFKEYARMDRQTDEDDNNDKDDDGRWSQ